MYTPRQISELRRRARRMHLLMLPEFWMMSRRQLCRICNGIGPETWPDWLRRLSTALLQFGEAPALGHDLEYALLPRTYWNFSKANARLAYNCVLCAFWRATTGRGFMRLAALGTAMGIACQLFGWCGFKQGKNNRR